MIAMKRIGLMVSVAAVAASLVGCGNTVSMKGKVIPGTVGVVTVVPANDERLLASTHASTQGGAQGVEGIKVELRRGQTVVASANTAQDGSFTMKMESKATASRYDVVATGPGIYPVRSTSYPAREGQVMLIVVDPRRIATEE
jgi:predicted small secreted protein